MSEYRISFGLRYAHEPHPTAPWVHPDGWLAVEAPTELDARLMVINAIGRAWAFIYDPSKTGPGQPCWGNFPRGELARLTPKGLTVHDHSNA